MARRYRRIRIPGAVIQLALLVPERVVILLCFAAFHAREIADMPLGVIPVRQLHVEVAYGHGQRLRANSAHRIRCWCPIKIKPKRQHVFGWVRCTQLMIPMQVGDILHKYALILHECTPHYSVVPFCIGHLRSRLSATVVAIVFAARPKRHFGMPLCNRWAHQ